MDVASTLIKTNYEPVRQLKILKFQNMIQPANMKILQSIKKFDGHCDVLKNELENNYPVEFRVENAPKDCFKLLDWQIRPQLSLPPLVGGDFLRDEYCWPIGFDVISCLKIF